MKLDNVIAKRKNKTVYRDGNKCIKLFDESYSKADVLNEALNLARVEQTGINVGKLLEVTTVDGKWAIVYEYTEGTTLAEMMEKDPANLRKYMERLVDIQLSIQAHTCPMLNKLKDKMQGKISRTKLDATTRGELHTRLEGMPTHNKVCHGDFNPSNVIITKDDEAYIIDDIKLIAYYTENTKRTKRLEKCPRGMRIGNMRAYYSFAPYGDMD